MRSFDIDFWWPEYAKKSSCVDTIYIRALYSSSRALKRCSSP